MFQSWMAPNFLNTTFAQTIFFSNTFFSMALFSQYSKLLNQARTGQDRYGIPEFAGLCNVVRHWPKKSKNNTSLVSCCFLLITIFYIDSRISSLLGLDLFCTEISFIKIRDHVSIETIFKPHNNFYFIL